MIPRLPRRNCRRAFGAVFRGFDLQDARTKPRPIVALDDMTLAGFDDQSERVHSLRGANRPGPCGVPSSLRQICSRIPAGKRDIDQLGSSDRHRESPRGYTSTVRRASKSVEIVSLLVTKNQRRNRLSRPVSTEKICSENLSSRYTRMSRRRNACPFNPWGVPALYVVPVGPSRSFPCSSPKTNVAID
jgi:hypothetical protein